MESFEHESKFWSRLEALDRAIKFAEVSPQIFDIDDLLKVSDIIWKHLTKNDRQNE